MGYVQAKIMANGKPCDVEDLTTEGLHEAMYQLRQLADKCEELFEDMEEEDEGENPTAEDIEGVPLLPIDTCPKCGEKGLTAVCNVPVRYAIGNCEEGPGQDWERRTVDDDESEVDHIFCMDCGEEWEQGKYTLNTEGFLVGLQDKAPAEDPQGEEVTTPEEE